MKERRPGPRLGSEKCPECLASISCKFLHKHTANCSLWMQRRGAPWPKFGFDRIPEYYSPSAVEGVDYVQCKICAECGWDMRFRRLIQHIEIHGYTEKIYSVQYPGAPIRLSSTDDRRRKTTLEKYGVDNVSKDPEILKKIGDVLEERYGSRCSLQAGSIKAKALETVRAKYGVDNVFESPEIQQRIRREHLEKYGVENPNQRPEIRAKTKETCLERYGVESFFQTGEFREKFEETCLERYGETHHMKSEEGRKNQVAGVRERYGVDNVLLVPEIFDKSYHTNLLNHGGVHSQTLPEVRAKAQATWMEKYGTDNPSKVPEVLRKIKEVWTSKYGVPFPPNSLHTFSRSEPNGLERALDALSPENVVYSGNAAYWVRIPGELKSRNPDFVVLNKEQMKAYLNGMELRDLKITATIEAFGDFWHGPSKTGLDRGLHKAEVETFYARAGVSCLILWEHEIQKKKGETAKRILKFLKDWRMGILELDRDNIFEMFS